MVPRSARRSGLWPISLFPHEIEVYRFPSIWEMALAFARMGCGDGAQVAHADAIGYRGKVSIVRGRIARASREGGPEGVVGETRDAAFRRKVGSCVVGVIFPLAVVLLLSFSASVLLGRRAGMAIPFVMMGCVVAVYVCCVAFRSFSIGCILLVVVAVASAAFSALKLARGGGGASR